MGGGDCLLKDAAKERKEHSVFGHCPLGEGGVTLAWLGALLVHVQKWAFHCFRGGQTFARMVCARF